MIPLAMFLASLVAILLQAVLAIVTAVVLAVVVEFIRIKCKVRKWNKTREITIHYDHTYAIYDRLFGHKEYDRLWPEEL